MTNKRIVKAARANNDFKRDWFIAERFQRCSQQVYRSAGIDLMKDLLDKWLSARKVWA